MVVADDAESRPGLWSKRTLKRECGRVFMKTDQLLSIIRARRSVRVYKGGKVSDQQLGNLLEAARWAPSGANTQPWEFVVTRDRKKMKRVREIYAEEWKQRKLEDPIH